MSRRPGGRTGRGHVTSSIMTGLGGGWQAANTLVSVAEHRGLLEAMRRDGHMPDQCMV